MRKFLIKLANRIESNWQDVDFAKTPIMLDAGWYVTEFILPGALQHTPSIIVECSDSKQHQRDLIGFHAGRNRMLIFLPQGRLAAHSDTIDFLRLSRVPVLEGRARILLICARYLRDFFSPAVVIRMLAMQFKNPADLSTELLEFYAPPEKTSLYLIERWQRRRWLRKLAAWWLRGIKVAVLIESDAQREGLAELHPPADLILLSQQDGIQSQDFDYLIPLAKTESLRQPAMLMVKLAIWRSRCKPEPLLLYSDHDYRFDEEHGDQVMEPVYKPQPSAPYLHCFAYLGFSVIYARELLVGEETKLLFNDEYQYHLALVAFKQLERIVHIPELLFQSTRQTALQTPAPISSASYWPDIDWLRDGQHNVLRASSDWQAQPAVDIIIPTRDGLDVLKPCVSSIIEKTSHKNFHIFIVDNGSNLEVTKDYLAEINRHAQVTVLPYPGEFNYSAINNFAATQGTGEFLALVNNDIEVIHEDWLSQMLVWAKQPEVGIVGAKLLFGNGLVQHAGVTIGMGNAAGHIHRLESGDAPGYQNRCIATQNMMAVTAACLVTPRALFAELGGLDEQVFKVAYNDIDYCLRVEQRGLDVIWTPAARLYHHESVSRGDDMSNQHIERYFKELGELQKRWKTKGFVDKYYSKHLRISDEGVYPQVTVRGQDKLVHY